MQDRLAKLKQTPSEFFKVDIGDGVQLDGWMMKPHDFDPQKRYPVLECGPPHSKDKVIENPHRSLVA